MLGEEFNDRNDALPSAPLSHPSPYFRTHCEIWIIALEVASVYKQATHVPIPERVPLAFVEAKHRKLVACMDKLGTNAVHGDACPAHALVL